MRYLARKQYVRSIATALVFFLGLIVPTMISQAQSFGNPGVVPPNARAYGLTYGQWSARHWQWVYSMSENQNPLTDTADCSAGQSGPVWFIGGNFAPTVSGSNVVGNANRHCMVPAGKALFFPIIDSECSQVEGNGTTDAEFRACAKFVTDHVKNLRATVDGVDIQNLLNYRVQSPLFYFVPMPDNNLLQFYGYMAPAGTTSPLVSDGVFLMLSPLSRGAHTIHFEGELVLTTPQDPFDLTFSLDITYTIIVV